MIDILYSNPCSYTSFEYLPYIHGILKGSVDDVPGLGDEVNWYKPIYYRKNHIKLSRYDLKNLNIFACSVYTWNRETNYNLAAEIKKENPNCLIVVGGPEPYYRDMEFFYKNPQIDIVVKHEGEFSFPRIVEEVVLGTMDFEDIPGLVLKNGGDTGMPILKKEFTKSYFHDYAEEFMELAHDSKKFCHSSDNTALMLESDRGCPFGCTFCDWGSSTLQKIRKIPLEIVYKDIEFAGEAGIGFIDVINANFGIFPRDINITSKMAQVKERSGYPPRIFLQHTKTKLDHTKEILKIARDAEMLTTCVLPLQSTSDIVLKAIDRKNIPHQELIKLAKETGNHNIPIESCFIMGLPGDNYDRWQQNFFDVMNEGILENFIVFHFQILPNSPANEPAYKKKWQIETIERHPQQRRRKKDNPKEVTTSGEFVISTSTYSRLDYIDIYNFSAMIRSFHGFGFTRYISIYLKLTHNILYEDFYRDFHNNFFINPKYPTVYSIYSKINEHINNFIFDLENDWFWEYEVEEVPTLKPMYDVEEYITILLLLNFAEYKKELKQYMRNTYDVKNLYSIMKFNLDLIITPDYDYTKGFVFTMEHDWQEYFKVAKSNWWSEPMDEPGRIKVSKDILQTTGNHASTLSKFKWLDYSGDKRTETYIRDVIATTFKRGDPLLFDMFK